jgi:hypothetical protein
MTVRLRDLPYLLYATGVCIVTGFMFFMQLLSMSDSYLYLGFPVPLLVCVLLPLFTFLGTACHEAGHAAAALLARLSILQIAFGTMVFVRHEKGFVSRGRDSSMEGLGGYNGYSKEFRKPGMAALFGYKRRACRQPGGRVGVPRTGHAN